ncbi:Ankyrin repeat and death domain-containing protein 1A [Araneus ventricosus]|uniref:Ankyrin repeat and death domain-containing protein 1A n=1 Tax=Araneus ventricosus TaxID=182803 RepID=A0A4Y2VRQ7_ARAVE|nr:Ankyrin repeat and death domain-containing protein 1A [Araneus ventricosus]GBO26861.1 Ankyrin repeat and death domain-containing protein 1A [Araneus ventricosus]GBO26862.1 Ankyrin repeat and death domain-containing protein 1A [Araneus ventricosus]GBO26864.1 Ankyrin repeat and death domain-containing protein 1A [Araneus ventricosus]
MNLVYNKSACSNIDIYESGSNVSFPSFLFGALSLQKSRTALHIAASLGYCDIVETLLKFGACLGVTEKHGNTPLHLAVLGNHPEMVALLMEKGIAVNTLNARQQTALHLAAELGYSEVAEVLLSYGADLSVPEKGGRKALYIAARGSYTAIVDMLIKVERSQTLKPVMDNDAAEKADPQCSPECVRQTERQAEAQQASMRDLLWTLSKNYLDEQDWKKLARHFGFTEEHIKAIERHYTGNQLLAEVYSTA